MRQKTFAILVLAALFFNAAAAKAGPDTSFFDFCVDRGLDADVRRTVVSVLHGLGVVELPTPDACRRGQVALNARDKYQPIVLRGVKDPSPLAQFKNIESVVFESSEKIDLRTLAKNRHLRAVSFERESPSELGLLGEMKSLTDLTVDVGKTPINIDGLYGAPLKVLNLRGHRSQPNALIRNVDDLGDIRTLEDLSLNEIAVPNLDFVRYLHSLNSLQINAELGLGISESTYSDIRPLEGLRNLVDLELGRGKITSIESLKHLPKLHTLLIGGNPISDFRPIAHLSSLEFLSLIDDGITAVSQIPVIKTLQKLDLSHNAIQDLKPLSDWTHLRALHLTANKIHDLVPVAGLKNLDVLFVEWNHIESFHPVEGLKAAHRDLSGREIKLRVFGETAEYQARP